jgi:anti-sigma B factor antagonist
MDTAGHEIGPAPLQLDRSSDGYGRVCLAVAGELDISNLDRLRQAVEGVLAEPGIAALVLDLRPLDFIDSSGVQVLTRGRRTAVSRGIDFGVINAHGKVLRVLSVLGVHDVLSITEQREDEPPITA